MFVAALAVLALLKQSEQVHDAIAQIECPSRVVIPMEPSARQAPVIDVEMGGKTYKFALDTGAEGGRISSDIVDALNLKPVGEVMAGDPSGKNRQAVSIYEVPEMKVGAATLHGVRMIGQSGITPHDTKAYFDGVLGYGAFHDVLLTLDYPHRQVILTLGGMSKDQLAKSIPYRLEHGIPFLDVQVGKVKIGGHVDSGSDGALSIPAKFQSELSLDGEPKKIGEARTLFNTATIYLAKVKDPISIGGVSMPIHEVELNDLFPFANIGGRVLHQFTVVIDQKAQRIAFMD